MTIHATGSFEVKSWDEKPYSEIDGQPKLTRADVVYAYHGDLEGEGKIAYLMCYSNNNGYHDWRGNKTYVHTGRPFLSKLNAPSTSFAVKQ